MQGSITKILTPVKYNRRGFTIVELLIVIVVIGILAAITIVSYNGIQARARNAQTVAAVSYYRSAMLLYATDKGAYPYESYAPTCVGEGYPKDSSGYGVCWDGSASYRESPSWQVPTLNDALRPYAGGGKLPLPSIRGIVSGTSKLVGAIWIVPGWARLDGVTYPRLIEYVLEGNEKCPIGPALTYLGWNSTTSTHDYSSSPPSGGYTQQWGDGVECIISMPAP